MSYVAQLEKARKLPKAFREFYEYLLIGRGVVELTEDNYPIFVALLNDGWILEARLLEDVVGYATIVQCDLTPERWAE